MVTLTVFTPTYNRAHLLGRLYESLCRQTCGDFEWLVVDDGSTDSTRQLVGQWQAEGRVRTHYIYKENGGLYTAYNAAYAAIQTPLNVCVDSDDYLPGDAVEKILAHWSRFGSADYAGLIGLDFDAATQQPLGGRFPEGMQSAYLLDLYIKRIHRADAKQVMRTDLMKQVAPQVGFEGEKFFNPIYMLLQVCDRLPLLVLNDNLCFVDYQPDSMSRQIYRQYANSPRSFAKLRLLEMNLRRNTPLSRLRSAVHYVAECLLAHDPGWLRQAPRKGLVLLMAPLGVVLGAYIKVRCQVGR